jgi:hypothetical protein
MSSFASAFFSHYKTTLFGFAASGLNLLANGTGFKQVAMSFALALLGIVAKDFNKSTVQ